MARPRSFDTTAVLDAAAAEFRRYGFEETSTQQLCEAAGVRRSSLYNAFTSKDELFVLALERYTETMGAAQESILADENLDGAARLRRMVDLIIDEELEARADGHAAGCMIVQSLMSPALRSSDPRTQAILDRDLERRLSLLAHTARMGQLDGSVDRGTSADEIAMLVVTIVSGIRVGAGAGVDLEMLRRVARTGLAAVLTD